MTFGSANQSQALLTECDSHEDADICPGNPTVGIVPALDCRRPRVALQVPVGPSCKQGDSGRKGRASDRTVRAPNVAIPTSSSLAADSLLSTKMRLDRLFSGHMRNPAGAVVSYRRGFGPSIMSPKSAH